VRSDHRAASGQSAAIYLKGERIGFIGVVHPELERKLDLNGRTLVFELEWNKLADRVVPQARDISASRRTVATSRCWSRKTWLQPMF
jgi:phenylalanyl-tRNA synthetase beta chain